LDKAAIDDLMAELKLPADSRAEQLSIEELIDLARAAQRHWQTGPSLARSPNDDE
jgi:hypothetical protein